MTREYAYLLGPCSLVSVKDRIPPRQNTTKSNHETCDTLCFKGNSQRYRASSDVILVGLLVHIEIASFPFDLFFLDVNQFCRLVLFKKQRLGGTFDVDPYTSPRGFLIMEYGL